MKIDKTRVHNILFITLSNIGDVVLTLPVLGVLKREFPQAKITIMVSPAAKEIFQNDPAISKIIVYDKHISFLEKINLGLRLRRKKFDLVVDLRSTTYPLLINAVYSTSLVKKKMKGVISKRYEHLSKLASLGLDISNASYNLFFSDENKLKIKDMLAQMGISDGDKIAAIAPGAKSHIKRWAAGNFADVCRRLNKELGVKTILTGDAQDKEIASQIMSYGLNDTYDATGQTSLLELSFLLSKCKLL
ncbi:MAG: glycosyltransferase family 9 protein, partial [Candidatus Omnitrophica bacterium]|nr:glycosyltransferase family 9 protein [Candidatus Omnitrophota bacterium]